MLGPYKIVQFLLQFATWLVVSGRCVMVTLCGLSITPNIIQRKLSKWTLGLEMLCVSMNLLAFEIEIYAKIIFGWVFGNHNSNLYLVSLI